MAEESSTIADAAPTMGNVSESLNMPVRNFSLPPDMVFGEAHVIAIVAYSILFFIGVTTNAASLRYVTTP